MNLGRDDTACMRPLGLLVFDLYGTLVATPDPLEVSVVLDTIHVQAGGPRDLTQRWKASRRERDCGVYENLAAYFAALGVQKAHVAANIWVASSTVWTSKVRPGAFRQLTKLQDEGWRLALCSNAGPEASTVFRRLEIASLFDKLVFSADVKACKPDVAMMVKVETKPNERVVFVGDGGSDELAGAERLGWQAVQVAEFQAKETDRWRELAGKFGGPSKFEDLGEFIAGIAPS